MDPDLSGFLSSLEPKTMASELSYQMAKNGIKSMHGLIVFVKKRQTDSKKRTEYVIRTKHGNEHLLISLFRMDRGRQLSFGEMKKYLTKWWKTINGGAICSIIDKETGEEYCVGLLNYLHY